MANEAFGAATIKRVEWLTIAFGGVGVAWASWRWGWRGGAALAIGSAVSWLNFRWMKTGVNAFGQAATAQAGSAEVRVPVRAYAKFLGRFALLLGTIYVILTRSALPAVPLFAGLFTSAAGVVAGLSYELLFSGMEGRAGQKP